jgi:hypothetical protein
MCSERKVAHNYLNKQVFLLSKLYDAGIFSGLCERLSEKHYLCSQNEEAF